jgi:hypothetical protein
MRADKTMPSNVTDEKRRSNRGDSIQVISNVMRELRYAAAMQWRRVGERESFPVRVATAVSP